MSQAAPINNIAPVIHAVSAIPDGQTLLALAARTSTEIHLASHLENSLGCKSSQFNPQKAKMESFILLSAKIKQEWQTVTLVHELHHLHQEFVHTPIHTGLERQKAAPLLHIALTRICEGATWAFTCKKTAELEKATGRTLPQRSRFDPALSWRELFEVFQTSSSAQNYDQEALTCFEKLAPDRIQKEFNLTSFDAAGDLRNLTREGLGRAFLPRGRE